MTPQEQQAVNAINSWHLGQTSARYETSNAGAGTISTGKGDLGGVSYGTYQLSSNMGTLQEFLEYSGYDKSFKGMAPKTQAFNAHWKDLALNDPKFAKAQHDFAHDVLFQPQMNKLQQAGFDFSGRGKAVQDMIWSTSVQYRDYTVAHFERAFPDKSKIATMTDQEIIAKFQDDKLAHYKTDFRSSPDLWNGIKNRIVSEKEDLLQLANQEDIVKKLKSHSQDTIQPPTHLGNYHHAATDAALNSLSPAHQRLMSDAHEHVHRLYQMHGMPIDQGTQNTVLSVAAVAAERGMTRIEHATVKEGQINLLQMNGMVAHAATIDGNVAANTAAEQSLNRLAELERNQAHSMHHPTQQMEQPHSVRSIT